MEWGYLIAGVIIIHKLASSSVTVNSRSISLRRCPDRELEHKAHVIEEWQQFFEEQGQHSKPGVVILCASDNLIHTMRFYWNPMSALTWRHRKSSIQNRYAHSKEPSPKHIQSQMNTPE